MYAVPEDLLARIPEEFRDPRKIRAFAVERGMSVGARGRISREIIEAYGEQFQSVFGSQVNADAVPF